MEPTHDNKKEGKKYIIFQPPDNYEVQEAVKNWISESGGSLALKEIENRFNSIFHFFYPQIYSEEEMGDDSPIFGWKRFAFMLENGVVYEK